MHDRLRERSGIECERYVVDLLASKPDELGMISARTPLCDAYTIMQTGVPHLINQIRAALDAKIWFSETEPDWGPLPMGPFECGPLLHASGAPFLLGCYAFSLELNHFDYLGHPQITDFCRGAMAHPDAPDHVRNDLELRMDFPAKELPGLYGRLVWLGEKTAARRTVHGGRYS